MHARVDAFQSCTSLPLARAYAGAVGLGAAAKEGLCRNIRAFSSIASIGCIMCQGKVLCNWECQLAKVLCLKAPVKNKAQLGSFAGEAKLNGLAVLVCQLEVLLAVCTCTSGQTACLQSSYWPITICHCVWGQLICKGLMPCDISSNERSIVFGLWRQGNVRGMTAVS